MKKVLTPREKCHPSSFRSEVYASDSEIVRLIYCCPTDKWSDAEGKCMDSMELHEVIHESDGGDELMPCDEVLKKNVGEFCDDFRLTRKWVMCRAWNMIEKGEAKGFREAVKKAWAELRTSCR